MNYKATKYFEESFENLAELKYLMPTSLKVCRSSVFCRNLFKEKKKKKI